MIPPPINVNFEGIWWIQGRINANNEDPIGSPSNATDATDARTFTNDQLYNVCPKIPDIAAIDTIMIRSLDEIIINDVLKKIQKKKRTIVDML